MTFKIKIGSIPVKFSGKTFLMDFLKKEFSFCPSTSETPLLTFSFDYLTALKDKKYFKDSVNVHGNFCFIKWGKFWYIITNEKNWHIYVYIDFYPPSNFLSKTFYWYKKFRHWNYFYHHEDLGKDFIYNIFDYIFQIVMLDTSNQTFIHASSVSANDIGFLFPALGGVGKTSLMLELIFDYNFYYLSDDLSIIDHQFIYLNPKFIQVYPYNLISNEKLAKILFKNRSFADKFNWYYKKWRRGLKGVRRRISPLELFPGKIIEKSPLKKIFFLRKCHFLDSKIKIYPITANTLSDFCTNILLQELFPMVNILTSIYSQNDFCCLPHLEEVIKNIKNKFLRIFENKQCYIVDMKDPPISMLVDSILRTCDL